MSSRKSPAGGAPVIRHASGDDITLAPSPVTVTLPKRLADVIGVKSLTLAGYTTLSTRDPITVSAEEVIALGLDTDTIAAAMAADEGLDASDVSIGEDGSITVAGGDVCYVKRGPAPETVVIDAFGETRTLALARETRYTDRKVWQKDDKGEFVKDEKGDKVQAKDEKGRLLVTRKQIADARYVPAGDCVYVRPDGNVYVLNLRVTPSADEKSSTWRATVSVDRTPREVIGID